MKLKRLHEYQPDKSSTLGASVRCGNLQCAARSEIHVTALTALNEYLTGDYCLSCYEVWLGNEQIDRDNTLGVRNCEAMQTRVKAPSESINLKHAPQKSHNKDA